MHTARTKTKVLITDTDYPDVDAFERPILEQAGFEVELSQCRTPGQLIEAGQGADALAVQYAPVTREVMDALATLRMISRYGVGVDTIDLEAAREKGIWVANVPDYGVMEVATHALAMLLSLIRHLPGFDRHVREGGWHYLAAGRLHRPKTLTLGIVGLGRIGGALARIAAPTFGRVLACDPYLPASAWPENVKAVDQETLFRQSEAVSLHVPLTKETRNLVDHRFLSMMPEGSYLVNTSRGGVMNLDHLLDALDCGQLAGAALDVQPQEPPPPDHPVLRHPAILLSPHSAYYSIEAERELRRKVVHNILSWAQTGRPPYVVVEGGSRSSGKSSV